MSRIRIIAGLSVMLSLASCKDFTFSGDQLTEADANDLAEEIVGAGFPGLGGVNSAPPAGAPGASAAAPSEQITININDSGPCEGGGTGAIVGSLEADVNKQAKTGTLQYEFTVTPTACVVTTKGGKTFTISGDPNLKGEGELQWQPTGFNGEFKYEGKFTWQSTDGRSGVCGVNLEANVNVSTGSSTTASASLTGSVCGATVNRSVTFEG